MYYYILEPPSSRSVRQIHQRLRDLLTNLGIAGEIVMASPARPAEELTAIGVNRGYSTIVAVGADNFINKIAVGLIEKAVLGIVPIGASAEIEELVGASGIKEAAEALKYRRLSDCPTVIVAPDTHLFISGVIESPKLAKVSLVLDNRVKAFAYFNRIVVNRGLEIKIESTHQTKSRRILGLFSVGGELVRSESSFHARSLRLVTDPELPMKVAGETIAVSPIQMRLHPQSLKVITRRGTLDR
ncbi:MAG: diacylglycerol kinase family protein [Patescibacteria group bacterium]